MITLDMIREYATALPGVDEKSHFGRPGFRVRDKLFVSVNLDGDNPSAIVNVNQTDRATAIGQTPAVIEEVWRSHGQKRIFVGLRVDLTTVSKKRCRELVELAWRDKSPKHLVAEYETGQSRCKGYNNDSA